jgi:hypothetical protein
MSSRTAPESPTQPAVAAALCIVCRPRPRPAKVGLLCGLHLERLARQLNPGNAGVAFDPDEPHLPARSPSVPVLFAELADLAAEAGERPGEHADDARANLRQMALRDARSKATGPGVDDDGEHGPWSVLATLGGWAAVVHEEHLDLHGRPDRLPVLARPGWIEVQVPVPTTDPDSLGSWRLVRREQPVGLPVVQAVQTLSGWLHARLDWIARQPWCDEFALDVGTLTAQLRTARGDPGPQPLGPCTALVDDDGAPDHHGQRTCGQPLWMPPTPPRAPDEPVVLPPVVCAACGTSWHGLAVLQLARERGGLEGGVAAPARQVVRSSRS